MNTSINILSTTVYWLFLSIPLFGAMYSILRDKSFDLLAVLAAAILSALLAVSALLYSRAQVWHKGKIQRRCLYAAEQCFSASLMFATGALIIAALLITAHMLHPRGKDGFSVYDLMLLISVVLLWIFFAFYKFIYGVRIAIHKRPSDLSPSSFIRQQLKINKI